MMMPFAKPDALIDVVELGIPPAIRVRSRLAPETPPETFIVVKLESDTAKAKAVAADAED